MAARMICTVDNPKKLGNVREYNSLFFVKAVWEFCLEQPEFFFS
jgi:hypothetical protein